MAFASGFMQKLVPPFLCNGSCSKVVGGKPTQSERKMKLLTHNMLTSHVRGVREGYPLALQATEVKVNTVDFNQEFVARMIPKLEWGALVEAADSLGHLSDLPKELISDFQTNEEFLRKVHHVLLEVEVIEGTLKCPESGKEFPINKGIPNMLLNEEES